MHAMLCWDASRGLLEESGGHLKAEGSKCLVGPSLWTLSWGRLGILLGRCGGLLGNPGALPGRLGALVEPLGLS